VQQFGAVGSSLSPRRASTQLWRSHRSTWGPESHVDPGGQWLRRVIDWKRVNWNGTSWSLLRTPSGVSVNAVTALSDGIVVATGIGSSGAVILSNVATGIGSSGAVILSNSPTPAAAPVGTTTSASTKPLRVPLDAALVDQFFATAGKVDQPLSLASHRSQTHDTAANGALDALSGGMWLWDRA
jgi:hypothetical protein